MHEPSALHGLAVTAVEWLPSGAESGLIRIRGRWTEDAARQPDLPVLALIAAGGEHRFDSLPDGRAGTLFPRDPSTWRGTYLVPAELVASDPDAMWLEWPSGTRSGLPALTRGVEPPPVPAAPERPEEPDEPGGQVIDRAVLAERRARRAEAAEQAQARVAAEALKAVEVLELRSTELERRLEAATTELGEQEAAGGREALAAALASAAALRSRAREWQLRMRTSEVTRAGDAVRLAVLESERASGAPAIRKALSERGAELEAARRELAAAIEAATAARAEAEAADRRFFDARAAWDRRREELESALAGARRKADEADALRPRVETLEAALATAEGRLQTAEAALAAAEARLRAESVARSTLEDELDRERAGSPGTLEADLEQERAALRTAFEADLDRERRAMTASFDADRTALRESLAAERRAMTESLDADRAALRESFDADRVAMRESFEADRASARAAFDADHAAVRAAFEADHAAIRTALAAAEQRVAAAEAALANAEPRAPEQLVRLADEQAAAAATREPAGDASRLVADLDAAAEALRRSAPPVDEPPPAVTADDPPAPESDDEPPAPDAEPAVEWADAVERERDPYVPGVEPVRAPGESEVIPWLLPGFESTGGDDPDEPPAPDAEPGVEWTPPDEPPPAAVAAVVVAPPPEVAAAPPEVVAAPAELQPEVATAPPEPVATPPEPEAKPGGPVIVSAPRPPARGLMIGTNRRDYPLLRGAIVKLAHDDPATAARLLVALLPAQGVAVEGPLAYDVTIKEAGTYGVAIAGGRASIERLAAPQPRSVADFHLIGDAVTIAELLAGVNHRIGRYFGPIRARGRKRRLNELRSITAGTISLADAARAGARLDPELVYRTFAYAVHPSWTRGHDFTIAQEIEGDPSETWYLTARDGAGVTAAATPPKEPDATVTMARDVFDRLLRGESVPAGRRPCVKGDPEVVETMRAWTDRARGDAG